MVVLKKLFLRRSPVVRWHGVIHLRDKRSRAPGENVGTYAILQGTLTISPMSSNYELTYVPANYFIWERQITVTADAKTKVYGTADPALTYQITDGALVEGDSFTGNLSRFPGEDVGTYTIFRGTLAISPMSSNYALTFNSATLTIDPSVATNLNLERVGGSIVATISPDPGGGTVTFHYTNFTDITVSLTVEVVSGQAVFVIPSLPLGLYMMDATFNGNQGYGLSYDSLPFGLP